MSLLSFCSFLFRAALRPPAQPMIDQDQGNHRLTHRHETRQQARIVPATGDDLGRLAGARHGPLRPRQAARRLDRHAADNRLAAGDAAEHSAVTIRLGADAVALVDEWVVVLAAAGAGDGETGAVLE